jgi:bis(5'-nucleosyl)-tetraphosphatase (symmetrical)
VARTIAIGDVHGCLVELQELIHALNVYEDDHLVFMGDLVDRGPFPVDTVRFVQQVALERRVTILLGNHEDKLTKWRLRESQRLETGRENKMRAPSPERQAQWDSFSESEVEWLRQLSATVQLPDNWVGVHAGLFPGKPLSEQKVDKIIRLRTLYPDTLKAGQLADEAGPLVDPPGTVKWTSLWKGPWSVVYGHAVHSLEHPRVDRMRSESGDMIACVGIDTGCCFGGRLTAAILLPNGGAEFVQVQAKRQYAELGKSR